MDNFFVKVTFNPEAKALMEKYYDLAFTHEIPKMGDYAKAWLDLAREFDKLGMVNMAGMTRERGLFYAQQAPGEYIRLIEGSFSELIQV